MGKTLFSVCIYAADVAVNQSGMDFVVGKSKGWRVMYPRNNYYICNIAC